MTAPVVAFRVLVIGSMSHRLRGGPNFDPVKYVKEVKGHGHVINKVFENSFLIQFELKNMDQK